MGKIIAFQNNYLEQFTTAMRFLLPSYFFASALATQAALSLSESVVDFDVSDGAAQSIKIDRQLISLSIE